MVRVWRAWLEASDGSGDRLGDRQFETFAAAYRYAAGTLAPVLEKAFALTLLDFDDIGVASHVRVGESSA